MENELNILRVTFAEKSLNVHLCVSEFLCATQ